MKILIAWELGGNWGHLASLLPMAEYLRAQGHEVCFSVRGLDGDLAALQRSGFNFLGSPIAISPLQKMHNFPICGYADVLARCGFSDPDILSQLTQAWCGLLSVFRPDLVICKYAPLAEFATRNCAVIAVGTGFEMPPLENGLPIYVNSSDGNSRVLRLELALLQSMQIAVKKNGFAKPESIANAFEGVRRFCLSWPALDHFGERSSMNYLGPVDELPCKFDLSAVLHYSLPQSEWPIVLVYLRKELSWWRRFLMLVAGGFTCRRWLIVAPGVNARECAELSVGAIVVVNSPVNWFSPRGMHEKIDAIVCHGGHGLISQALSCGIRTLILPMHMEQLMLLRRLYQLQRTPGQLIGLNASVEPDRLVQAMACFFKYDFDRQSGHGVEIFRRPVQDVVDEIMKLL